MLVLAIDGGGVRGIAPAYLLARIEQETGTRIKSHFDMVAGTSTGAIVATAVAAGIPMEQVVQVYRRNASRIFRHHSRSVLRKWAQAMIRPLYDSGPLMAALKEVFSDRKLGDIHMPLIIPAINMATGRTITFKSGFNSDYVRDLEISLVDAIVGSCAAPGYFPPHKFMNRFVTADGGLWANNPALVALAECVYTFGKSLEDVRVVSLGTGHTPKDVGVKKSAEMFGVKSVLPLAALAMDVSSQSVSNTLNYLIGDKHHRLDFQMSHSIGLDDADPDTLTELEARADDLFVTQWGTIAHFLQNGDQEVSS